MLPVYVTFDSGIDALEERAILDGIAATMCFSHMRRELRVFGAMPWSEGDYSSADWYVKHTRKIYQCKIDGVQLDADHLLDLLSHEPWQESEPHIDVMFVSQDLTARNGDGWLNFVFGIANGRVTVQSVARYREIANLGDRMAAIKMVAQHELGHVFGMAGNKNRSNTEDNLGMHCTNPGCVMRQGLSVPEWVRHARESYRSGIIYCPQCLADAAKVTF